MATIPVYNRQVTPGAAPTPQAPQGAFGGDMGAQQMAQGLGEVANAFAKRAAERKQQEDQTMALKALTQAGDQVRQSLYNDEGTGILQREGEDALGSYQEAVERAKQIHEDISKNLANQEQKTAFEQVWARERGSMLDATARHESSQFQKVRRDNADAGAAMAAQKAAMYFDDPRAIQGQIDTGIEAIESGYSGEARDRQIKAFRSSLHTGVIERMAQADAGAAREYYEQHEDQILGEDQTNVLRSLGAQHVRQRSQDEADRIMAQYSTRQDRLAAARRLGNDPSIRDAAEVRDAVVKRINARAQEEKLATAEAEEAVYEDVINRIIDAPGLEAALVVAHELEGTDRLNAMKVAETLKSGQAEAAARVTDPQKYAEAHQKIDAGLMTPARLMDYAPYLSEDDWENLTDYWQKGGIVGDLSESRLRTIWQNRTNSSADDDHDEWMRTYNYVRRNLPTDGRTITDDLLNNLIDQAYVDGYHIGGRIGGWGEKPRTLKWAWDQGIMADWMPDVSKDEERQITEILRKNGKAVTQRNIRLYKKHVMLEIPRIERVEAAQEED